MDKILTLKIEKISSSAEGIGYADGMVVFVENALPGDVVEVEVVKEHKSFLQAKILKFIEKSNDRIEPFCPLYNACGACNFQHANYKAQLKFKKAIVQDAINTIGGLDIKVDDVVPSPETKEFRAKIQYPTGQTKVSKRILAGYYKPKSHEITNIKYCPIQPKICDEIIEFIRVKAQELGIICYNDKTKTGSMRHIVIRYSMLNKNCLVTIVINNHKITSDIETLSQEIYNKFNDIIGVCVNFNTTKSNLILTSDTKCLFGKDKIEEKLLDKTFLIGANTFFQVNPKSAENIFKYVKEIIQNNFSKPYILDAYAGIAAFGIVTSDIAEKVLSIEENKNSTDLAKEVLKLNKINNVEIKNADTGEYLKNSNDKFDVIILDPPRKGCDIPALDNALRLCKSIIIYVSCNPATLARDLKYLNSKGAKISSIRPFDMFCHSTHVENVAIIKV